MWSIQLLHIAMVTSWGVVLSRKQGQNGPRPVIEMVVYDVPVWWSRQALLYSPIPFALLLQHRRQINPLHQTHPALDQQAQHLISLWRCVTKPSEVFSCAMSGVSWWSSSHCMFVILICISYWDMLSLNALDDAVFSCLIAHSSRPRVGGGKTCGECQMPRSCWDDSKNCAECCSTNAADERRNWSSETRSWGSYSAGMLFVVPCSLLSCGLLL